MYKDVQYICYIFENNGNNPNIQQGITKINYFIYLLESYVVNFLRLHFQRILMTYYDLNFVKKNMQQKKKD